MVRVTPDTVSKLGTAVGGIGLVLLTFHAVTYTEYVDDIGILEKKGGDATADVPLGLLLPIEVLASVLLFVAGMGGGLGSRNKVAPGIMFFLCTLATIFFAGTAIYRTSSLWGENEGQCKYTGDPDIHGLTGDYIKACPTSRHEAQKPSPSGDTWNITQKEPILASDCVFWFWDNTFTLESAILSSGGNSDGGQQVAGQTIDPAKIATLKNEMIQNMDWADKHSYGFFPVESDCSNDLGATDCIPDGRTVFETIEVNAKSTTDGGADKYGVSIVKPLPGPDGNKLLPDITFCYYWGCNEICNEFRYRINRLLHYASGVGAFFALIFTAISGVFAAGTKVNYDAQFLGSAANKGDLEAQSTERNKKWKPMNVDSSVTRRKDSKKRSLRF
jgi:hypothetical protein